MLRHYRVSQISGYGEFNSYRSVLARDAGDKLHKHLARLYAKGGKPYHDKALTTQALCQIIQSGLTKYTPSYLVLKREIFKSYSQFKKLGAINWEKATKLIPQVQIKFFATLNKEELTRLKKVRFEKDSQIYQRNYLILDFLFYSGIRVSELTHLKHSDWEDNHLKI